MRWKDNCYEGFSQPWFAWFPVNIEGSWVWLETVTRTRTWIGDDWYWEYKA